jgi:DeoR family ulaG and ulaABCDEF operon transcriptional repressor
MFMSASASAIGPLGLRGDALIARAETKLLKRTEKLVVLADASKFMASGSLVLCTPTRIHRLITDSAAPPEALALLSEAGVKTVVVEPESHSSEAA